MVSLRRIPIASCPASARVQELEESFFKREEKKREFEELLEGNKDRIDGLMDDKKALDQVPPPLSPCQPRPTHFGTAPDSKDVTRVESSVV